MKKSLIILTILLSTFVFSQEFIFTENNYKLKEDNSKDYIVIDFPGKNKEELYILAKKYINSNYPEAKSEDLKEIQNEQIIADVTSQSSRTIYINKKGSNVWNVVNNFEISFKDNKIKVHPIFTHLINTADGSKITIGAFYNSRGILRLENASYFAEAFTNTFIRNLKKEMIENKSNDW